MRNDMITNKIPAWGLCALFLVCLGTGREALAETLQEFPISKGSHPHDVAPSPDGPIWYTAQSSGQLGRLDPKTGKTEDIALGRGSRPHGVIVGPDGAAWVTDGGLNAIIRVDPTTLNPQIFPLPKTYPNVGLNTATFDHTGILWFTGQNGFYGRLDPKTGRIEVFADPRGPGPYGMTTAPDGTLYYASLAGNYIARVDLKSGAATLIEPSTRQQGSRRLWADSHNRIWVSEWNVGQLARYDPTTQKWKEWRLPGSHPMAYAVFVDGQDKVWLSDFGANTLMRFDPVNQQFEVFPLPTPAANVRQLMGRLGEVWGAESGADKLVVVRRDN